MERCRAPARRPTVELRTRAWCYLRVACMTLSRVGGKQAGNPGGLKTPACFPKQGNPTVWTRPAWLVDGSPPRRFHLAGRARERGYSHAIGRARGNVASEGHSAARVSLLVATGY